MSPSTCPSSPSSQFYLIGTSRCFLVRALYYMAIYTTQFFILDIILACNNPSRNFVPKVGLHSMAQVRRLVTFTVLLLIDTVWQYTAAKASGTCMQPVTRM